jgi:hypothetical protein
MRNPKFSHSIQEGKMKRGDGDQDEEDYILYPSSRR